MFQEGQPRRLGIEQGDRVRVPDPKSGGMVKAVVLSPAEVGSKVRFAWVRYLEGSEQDEIGRVDCSYIEPV